MGEKEGKDLGDKERIKRLEAFESLLVDRLKNTHVNQRNQYETLQNIVKESHGYYINSLISKREKGD
jgi:hypothetical protein